MYRSITYITYILNQNVKWFFYKVPSINDNPLEMTTLFMTQCKIIDNCALKNLHHICKSVLFYAKYLCKYYLYKKDVLFLLLFKNWPFFEISGWRHFFRTPFPRWITLLPPYVTLRPLLANPPSPQVGDIIYGQALKGRLPA